jgi:hypothetical protein
MKILFFTMTALILNSVAYAQTGELFKANKPIVCGNLGEIMEKITGADWREEPIWRGGPNEYQNMTTLFFNSETGSWTLIEYRNQTGCILGNGMSSQLTDRINIIK